MEKLSDADMAILRQGVDTAHSENFPIPDMPSDPLQATVDYHLQGNTVVISAKDRERFQFLVEQRRQKEEYTLEVRHLTELQLRRTLSAEEWASLREQLTR